MFTLFCGVIVFGYLAGVFLVLRGLADCITGKCWPNFSRRAAIYTAIYLGLCAAAYAYVTFSARTNPGDSGESGILFLPLIFPWFMLYHGPGMLPLGIVLNTAFIYGLAGGLKPSSPPPLQRLK